MDPYATLGVPEDATQDEITRAYRKLMRHWNVDHHQGMSELEKRARTTRMQDINRAHSALHPATRESTDHELRRQREKARAEDELEAQRRREQLVAEQRRAQQAKLEAEQQRLRNQRTSTRQPTRSEVRWVSTRSWSREEWEYRSDGSVTRKKWASTREEVSASSEVKFFEDLRAALAASKSQDVHLTLPMSEGQWRSRVRWKSPVDGQLLRGLEDKAPGVYCFRGRGRGVEGAVRGDLVVTLVHVDDAGQEVSGGFVEERGEPPVNQPPESQRRPQHDTQGASIPISKDTTGGFWHRLGTALLWGALILVCLAILIWFSYGR